MADNVETSLRDNTVRSARKLITARLFIVGGTGIVICRSLSLKDSYQELVSAFMAPNPRHFMEAYRW